MVSIKGVSHKYFGYPECIHDISLEIGDGEKILLYGGARSGKTTLLKIIAGLLVPECGTVSVDAVKVGAASMIFEDLALPSFQTARGILARPWRLRGMKRRESEQKAAEVAIRYEILGLLDTPSILMEPYNKVRTAVARGFMRNASLTIVDNPLSLLTLSDRVQYQFKLAEYINATSGAVIYATDDFNELRLYEGRIGILHYGSLVQIGTLTELQRNPSSVAVARLVRPTDSFIKASLEGELYTPLDEEQALSAAVIGEFRSSDLEVKEDGDYPAQYAYTLSDGTNAYAAFGTLIFARGVAKNGYITPDFNRAILYDIKNESKIN